MPPDEDAMECMYLTSYRNRSISGNEWVFCQKLHPEPNPGALVVWDTRAALGRGTKQNSNRERVWQLEKQNNNLVVEVLVV